ncbi:hypothetical protein DV738_g3704, partial [Chaetothyriales sp. CBS 135597]
MLPDFLKDSYKQYKDDTNRFAAWLVNMAKACGYNLDTLPTPSHESKSNSRAKGKQRQKKVEQDTAPEPKLYQVSVREMYKLAEVVSKSSVKVPPSVLAVAKRAITLRKAITSYFIGKGSSASNRRHAYFIEVLEEICKSLSSDDGAGTLLSGKEDDNADDPAWLNRFASLTVEAAEDTTETVSEGRELVKVVAVEEDEAADPGDQDARFLSHAFFRVFCLFHDLEKWRNFLSQTWTEYSDRKIDLMTASIITDSALQLAEELIQETVADMPSQFPQDSIGLQQLVYASLSMRRGKRMTPDTHLGLTFSLNMADIAEWTYLGVASLLESMTDVIEDDSIPLYKPDYFGLYDSKADRKKMSVPEKFNEDKLILLELLPEFCIIERFKLKLPVQDGITRGFVKFTKNKETTLWLSFAVQVLLDAIHATRTSRLDAWADLRLTGLRITKTIDDYWKLSKTHPKPQFWPAEGDKEIKNIRECILSFVERNPLQPMKDMSSRRLGGPAHASSDHLIFSRNPVLCGLTAFHLNLRMQTIGQALVTQWYDVQELAFLYNLVQQSPGRSISWPDMELFIKVHGEERIFLGNRPKDASQSLNRLEIVTGISSVTRFASDARQRSDWHSPDGKSGRKLEPTTKVANIFRERYQDDAAADKSEPIIYSSQVSKYLDELSETSTDKKKPKKSKEDKGKELTLALSSADQLLGRRWQNTHNVGALQLLALIKGKLRQEEPILLFNYFAMHRRSIEIMRLIKAKEHHKFVQYFTEGYMPDETLISNLVILIHHVARGSAASGQQLGLGKKQTQITSRMVVSCSDVMREYLAKHGDDLGKELRVFCRNTDFLAIKDGKADKKEVDYDSMYVFGLEQILSPGQLESLRTGIPLA